MRWEKKIKLIVQGKPNSMGTETGEDILNFVNNIDEGFREPTFFP